MDCVCDLSLDDWKNVSTIVSGVMAIVVGAIAAGTYAKNVRVKRAEWLASLHDKYYVSRSYKRIRRILDYRAVPDYDALKTAVAEGGNDKLQEALVDYLNFFEFIASLWKMEQLSAKEISMLFEYYLLDLQQHAFVMSYIEGNNFQNLAELIAHLGPPKH